MITAQGKQIGEAKMYEWVDWNKHTLEPVYTTDKSWNTELIALELVVRDEYL